MTTGGLDTRLLPYNQKLQVFALLVCASTMLFSMKGHGKVAGPEAFADAIVPETSWQI